MKISIHFFDQKGNLITSIYENTSDNFNVGDKLYFNVSELYPNKINELKEKFTKKIVRNIIESNELIIKNYHAKRFKIIKKYISLRIDDNFDDIHNLTIVYTVKKCSSFRWKWWYIKAKIKNIFK